MLAILKGETAETGITLDERQNGETNPISHNQLAINGLRLGRGRRPRRETHRVGAANQACGGSACRWLLPCGGCHHGLRFTANGTQ